MTGKQLKRMASNPLRDDSRRRPRAPHRSPGTDSRSGPIAWVKPRLPAIFVVIVLAAGAGVIGWNIFSSPGSSATVSVTVPTLSSLALTGEKAFDTNCASCHGANAAGGESGPPLVHDIYNPGHHADEAFFRAVTRGVPRHHWNFGNMPPIPGVTPGDAAAIVRYVRELQNANGIFWKPHRM